MNILLTGGAGYIGSHAAVALMEAGHWVVCLDSYSNSSAQVADRFEQTTGSRPIMIEGDIRDRSGLDALFGAHRIDAFMHFAGLKAVGESVAQPLACSKNNVWGTACLLQTMAAAGIRQLVFSSSATVFGAPFAIKMGTQIIGKFGFGPMSVRGGVLPQTDRGLGGFFYLVFAGT